MQWNRGSYNVIEQVAELERERQIHDELLINMIYRITYYYVLDGLSGFTRMPKRKKSHGH